jgi:hypothetical protein
MGNQVFGQIQVIEKIASNQLKLIPDVYVAGAGGGSGGGDDHSGLVSLALLQYLMGKNLVAPVALPAASAETPPTT